MALSRYKIPYMKKLPVGAPEAAEDAVRKDTRKHTKHFLRPTSEIVEPYLAGQLSWVDFSEKYREILEGRFSENRTPFDELAALADASEVFIGCNCPSALNPDVSHCHTVLALQFMQAHYPELVVRFPPPTV